MELTQALVRELFDYDPEGFLVWKNNHRSNKVKDKRAGTHARAGYEIIRIKGVGYRSHRLIYLWHHGYMPPIVDHFDREPANNKINNLRPATKAQNAQNSESRRGSSSRYKGVCFDKAEQKWLAAIWTPNKYINLGRFIYEADAAMAFNEAALELHGEFVVLNDNPLNHIALVDSQDLKSLSSTNEGIYYVGIIGS